MTEIWKNIKGYESEPNYQVSNYGRIKRVSREGDKILIPFYKHGYLYIGLCRGGKQKHFRIHRLVADAFISNPLNLPEVNHKDEDKTNNRVDNLERCSPKYNANYGTRNRKISDKLSKSVVAIDKGTNREVRKFKSITEASKFFPNANRSHIASCCKGVRKTAGGYKWRYAICR